MKLSTWCVKHGVVMTSAPGGLAVVHDTFDMASPDGRNARAELWHLTDYIVTSVVAGVIRLVYCAPLPDEPKARAADEPSDTDQSNPDDGGTYDNHDFDSDPDWR